MNQSAPTYSSFLAITVSYLFLPVILYLFIVAPSWHSLPNDLSMMAMLCALPAMVAAAVSGLVLDRNKVLDGEGKVSTSKVMTGALIVYALAELSALLGIFLSNSRWGVIIGVGFFPVGKCAIVNSEDGICYRWDFVTNTVTPRPLTNGIGEAYTPTAIGPDGTAYLINNHVMFAATANLAVAGLSLSQNAVQGGTSVTGFATLNIPALNGGATVLLSSNKAAATVPSSILVPATQKTKDFVITTSPVAATTLVTITASRSGISKTAILTLTKTVALAGLALSTDAIAGGVGATGTVTMSGPTPSGGASVVLSSSNTGAATVPTSVLVPTAASFVNFPITTLAVAANTTVTITASRSNVARSATLLVTKLPALRYVSTDIANITGGSSATGTLTLSSPAPAGGANVVVTSSDTSLATVPGVVTVPAGALTTAFAITTFATGADRTVTITASRAFITRTTTLTVLAPVASRVELDNIVIVGGNPVQGTVELTGPAPTGGVVVQLTTSNSAIATVPASVYIPAGQLVANFPVTTLVQNEVRNVLIYGVKKTSVNKKLKVTP